MNNTFEKIQNEVEKEHELINKKFPHLSLKDLADILDLTVKADKENKIISFLCQLSAFTSESQFNISFNAPSSSGKSYIPTEIAKLFPQEDVISVGYCSPTAFFHDKGVFDKAIGGYIVDLSRKILIFLDQPHNLLLEHLRPLLSHDNKEIKVFITDKDQKRGLRKKIVILKGFPAVIFCSAGLRIDEQEATRFLLLSPEINQEKIRQAVLTRAQREADLESYNDWLDADPRRKDLQERISAIRAQKINDIKIINSQEITDRFFDEHKILKPRHSRDVARLFSLIKTIAMINVWERQQENNTLFAIQQDIDDAFEIWNKISESQEYNLPPYIFQLFNEVIKPAFQEKNKELISGGLSRNEIIQKHFQVYGRHLPDWQLRQQIIPMLDTAGLITQEPDPDDKRRMLIYPTTALNISTNNSE